MLTMEQVYRIKNMSKFEGKSLRKISKITRHNFQTVKKYVTKQHTARRVFDRLRELYGETFDASERSVRKFVAVFARNFN